MDQLLFRCLLCNAGLLILLTLSRADQLYRPPPAPVSQSTQGWVTVAEDGKGFRAAGKPFTVFGVNYDHDRAGRLLEEYWLTEWQSVKDDFREIKRMGVNTVRIHLQLARFMLSASELNQVHLKRLGMLIELAETEGLYLNITGLGCYHKQDVPDWYDALPEQERWQTQVCFWQGIAQVCKSSSAVFCYDLMNEPILPGKDVETNWLTGELAGKTFVQRIALNLSGRSREQVAQAWVQRLCSAIREIDSQHLITVGVIPWAQVFPNAKPIFYSAEVCEPLDFVSVHFYPKAGQRDATLTALQVYEIGKPLVIEEIFPLHGSIDDTLEFMEGAREFADGWISFYWGETAEECEKQNDLAHQLTAAWLKRFKQEIQSAAK